MKRTLRLKRAAFQRSTLNGPLRPNPERNLTDALAFTLKRGEAYAFLNVGLYVAMPGNLSIGTHNCAYRLYIAIVWNFFGL